jgi:DNA-binding MarR family transcriptional regulator
MPEYQNAGVDVIRLGMWNHRLQSAIAKDVDLPVYQLECVLLLALDEPDSAGSLALLLGVRKSSLSKLLKMLERRGLVCRALDSNDRRMERVTLTEAGRALVERVLTRANEIASEVLEKLPEERRSQFLGCMRTITAYDVPVDQQSRSKLVESSHEPIIP